MPPIQVFAPCQPEDMNKQNTITLGRYADNRDSIPNWMLYLVLPGPGT